MCYNHYRRVSMEKISYKTFLHFIASDLDEVEYFGCDKTSLMSLKEYLIELKERKEEFDKLISEPLKSIKSKNKWVVNVVPRYDGIKEGVIIQGKNDPFLGVGIWPELAVAQRKKPNDYILTGGMIITPFHNLKFRNRIKVLDNSQNEIREIDTIARKMNFIKEEFDTISNYFSVKSSLYDVCDIECFNWPIIRAILSTGDLQEVKPLMSDETFYKKEGIYPKPLTLEERKKLVKKLYIKR